MGTDSSGVPSSALPALGNLAAFWVFVSLRGSWTALLAAQVPEKDRTLGTMEFTASPKPQLSSRANAFSIAALMSSGGPKEKEAAENTIKPLGKSGC